MKRRLLADTIVLRVGRNGGADAGSAGARAGATSGNQRCHSCRIASTGGELAAVAGPRIGEAGRRVVGASIDVRSSGAHGDLVEVLAVRLLDVRPTAARREAAERDEAGQLDEALRRRRLRIEDGRIVEGPRSTRVPVRVGRRIRIALRELPLVTSGHVLEALDRVDEELTRKRVLVADRNIGDEVA